MIASILYLFMDNINKIKLSRKVKIAKHQNRYLLVVGDPRKPSSNLITVFGVTVITVATNPNFTLRPFFVSLQWRRRKRETLTSPVNQSTPTTPTGAMTPRPRSGPPPPSAVSRCTKPDPFVTVRVMS